MGLASTGVTILDPTQSSTKVITVARTRGHHRQCQRAPQTAPSSNLSGTKTGSRNRA